ncbi:MAG: hypothetical protein HY434_01480 [Candidatus Liptonbacteria bacterium]|nr:hypothetical protein [Candidatus Liptonbacteria bacterium]
MKSFLRLLPFAVVLVFSTSRLEAQEITDWQNRTILHEQADVAQNWFLAGWVIGNAQVYGTDNINLFGGIGYRSDNKKWWLESMVQRQWSAKGEKILLDNRFQYQSGRTSLYVEAAPFLDRRAMYDMVIVEEGVWRKVNIGAETENVHKGGLDSLGAGPRVSLPLGILGKFKVATAAAYQFRRSEQNAFRVYVVFSHRHEHGGR